MTDTLKKYTPQFIEELEFHCCRFKILGLCNPESPKWIQYRGIDRENNLIKFASSQRSAIGFNIPIDPNDLDTFAGNSSKVYDYFRSIKYSHIQTNHPTIK